MAVRTGIDIGRLKGALRSPGIDTRMNLVIGEVVDDDPPTFDAEYGMFADVKVQPDLHTETCLVGSDYAGNDYGEWNPLHVGDLVLVALPMGDPGYGPIIVARIWNVQAKPPAEFQAENAGDPMDPATDRTIVVDKSGKYRIVARDGAKVAIEMSGGGDFDLTAKAGSNINLTGEDTITVNAPKVLLADGAKQVACVGDITVSALSVADAAAAILAPSPTGVLPVFGQITTGRAKVKA